MVMGDSALAEGKFHCTAPGGRFLACQMNGTSAWAIGVPLPSALERQRDCSSAVGRRLSHELHQQTAPDVRDVLGTWLLSILMDSAPPCTHHRDWCGGWRRALRSPGMTQIIGDGSLVPPRAQASGAPAADARLRSATESCEAQVARSTAWLGDAPGWSASGKPWHRVDTDCDTTNKVPLRPSGRCRILLRQILAWAPSHTPHLLTANGPAWSSTLKCRRENRDGRQVMACRA